MIQFNSNTDIKGILEKEGKFVGTTVGVSMRPMIRSGKDVIVVDKKTERLKPYDVALYTRGNAYVLHRVLTVRESDYVIRGDNCYADEYVPEDAVIGVLTGFFRGEKEVDLNGKKYQRYVNKRIKTYPARKRAYKAHSFVKRIIKKIIGRK